PEDPLPDNQPEWETSSYVPAQAANEAAAGEARAPDYPPAPGYDAAPGYAAPDYEAAPGYAPSAQAPALEHPYHLTPAFDPTPAFDAEADAPLTSAPTSFHLRFTVVADDAYDTNIAARLFIRWFVVVAIAIALVFIAIAWLRGTLDLWTIGACVLLILG